MKFAKLIGAFFIFLSLIFISQNSNASTLETMDSTHEVQTESTVPNIDQSNPEEQVELSDSSSSDKNTTSTFQQEEIGLSSNTETIEDSSALPLENTNNTSLTMSSSEEEPIPNEFPETQNTTSESTTETNEIREPVTTTDSSSSNTDGISIEEYMLNVANFNKLSIADVKNLFYVEGETVLYIGRPTCYYCRQFSPELKEFNEIIGNTLSYYDTDGLDFDEQAANLIFVQIGIPGTPTTMYIKDGQIISAWVGGELTGKELYDFLFQNQKSDPIDSRQELEKDTAEENNNDIHDKSVVFPAKKPTIAPMPTISETNPKNIQIKSEPPRRGNEVQKVKSLQSKNELNKLSDGMKTIPKLGEQKSSFTIIEIALLFTGFLFIVTIKNKQTKKN